MDVELHGTASASFGKTVNDVIDSILEELFREKDFRFWECLGTNVALPSVKFDSVFIFTHFIQHFYHSGLGLPKEEMPFYDPQFAKYSDMIWASMKHSGNFGRKMNAGRDIKSESFLLRKARSLKGHLLWMSRHFTLSPKNTLRALCGTIVTGVAAAVKGQ